MTQDERWLIKYNEIMAFMAENHRRPSKYYMEERNSWNWMRHCSLFVKAYYNLFFVSFAMLILF